MRFDLTVPLARFAAQHANELGMPFKRYHIGPVWRGENPQRGRYREFVQCDFDTVGTEALASDVETALVIHDLLQALGVERFTIRMNDRRILQGLLQAQGLEERAVPMLRALDKLDKIGADKVAAEMREAGATDAQAGSLLALAELGGSSDAVLSGLAELGGTNDLFRTGHERLRAITDAVLAAGVSTERVRLDPSIARGLDYYTGAVFETFLDDLPAIGSVCSGGRYDDLAGLFTKERLPGIGASLGVDRLLAALEELGQIDVRATTASIFVPFFAADRLGDYLRLAGDLRRAGLAVELYPEPKKLGQQLKYADRRGFETAVIVGDAEWEKGVCQIKDLRAGTSREVPLAELERELLLPST
jgi:histidyl-tRNA synthetase